MNKVIELRYDSDDLGAMNVDWDKYTFIEIAQALQVEYRKYLSRLTTYDPDKSAVNVFATEKGFTIQFINKEPDETDTVVLHQFLFPAVLAALAKQKAEESSF